MIFRLSGKKAFPPLTRSDAHSNGFSPHYQKQMTGKSPDSRASGWKYDLFLSVPEMDAEHHELVDIIENLRNAVAAGACADDCRRTLLELIQAAAKHFASEEQLMTTSGYSGYAEHRAQHEKLLAQLRGAESDFESGVIHPCDALSLFVEVWATEHILGPDKAL